LGSGGPVGFIENCAQAWQRSVQAFNEGERRPLVLASHIYGVTNVLVETSEAINQLNRDAAVTFSNASINERILPATRVGLFGVLTAEAIVGGFPAAKGAIKSARTGNFTDLIENLAGVACSFSADTLVSTIDGYETIAQLMRGELVLAYNEATGEIGYYPITAVWSEQHFIIEYITVDGERIATTPKHPFFIQPGKWVAAGELQVGDHIRKADGSYGEVQAIEFIYQPQPMYNLSVAEAHTYFVGVGQWLVHNDCSSTRLSKNLGGKSGDQLQAHHLIPCEFCDHPFVRRARVAGWDMDAAYNGILLPDNQALSIKMDLPYHSSDHLLYSAQTALYLNQLEQQARQNNINNQQSFDALMSLADALDRQIRNMGGGRRLP
jgi:hypothetical protein